MWHDMWAGSHYGWWGMGTMMILLVGVLLVAMAKREPERGGSSPLDILKRRLATGEISEDEFDRIRHDLES